MSWKKFKLFFENHKIEESHFILGLDIGNQSSSVAFYNPISRSPEIIDISGGYGRPSIPTSMQHIPETNEWVFGEYAVLNGGAEGDISFSGLVERLGKKDYVEINSKPVSISQLLSIFVKELIGNCKSINPKAEIAGLVTAVPSYMSEEAKTELLNVMKSAGYEKSVIELAPDRECIFARHYFNRPVVSENVLLLDFGSREIRGGVYKVSPSKNGAEIKSLSSMFDKDIGTGVIDNAMTGFFTEYYKKQLNIPEENLSEQALTQLSIFSYQHKDLLFQKNKFAKPIKLYYNFAYPPFQQQVTAQDVENILRPFHNRFAIFLMDTLKKTAEGTKPVLKAGIDTVICTGGGFEMLWAREAVQKAFPSSNIKFFKNSKGVLSEGASIIAASKLHIIPDRQFVIEDSHQIKEDICVKTVYDKHERFIPLIERNAFWWQRQEPKSFIVNESTSRPIYITLFKRDDRGEISLLDKLVIQGLPERPAGTTRLKIALEFVSHNKLTATVADMGFGDMFPVTGYSEKFVIDL